MLLDAAKVISKSGSPVKTSLQLRAMAVLDSDDESLAEFIGDLSSPSASGEKATPRSKVSLY